MLIGLLPTYETIGILAPIILVFLRIAQGFSVGGEVPGAMTFITESFPNRKGFLLGVIFCFVHLGIALGFIVQAILIQFFSSQEMISFAWRIPFVVGGLLGFIIFFLRRYLLSDENFQPFVQEKYAFPVTKLFATHGLQLLLGSIIISFTSMCFVSLFLMLPTYLNTILHLDSLQYSWINCLGALMISVVCMLTGSLVDREDKESILALSIFLTIFLVFLVFYIYVHEPAFYGLAILISSLLIGVFAGCAPAVLVDLYNQDVRYTGIGFAYNVGVSIFSGITPFMIIFTIKISGNTMAPAYLLFFSGLFVLAFVCFYRYIKVEKTYHES